MKFLRYLYYRMYNAYRDKNDTPIFRTFMYLTLFQFLITGAFLIYMEKLLILGNILSEAEIDQINHSYLFWGIIILVIFSFTYFSFTCKDISYYNTRFSKAYKANKYIKVWMLIVLPFLFFFLSIALYIFLFGGEVIGDKVLGILNAK
jgi:cytosine/uracil/thiamine/allantoin permease